MQKNQQALALATRRAIAKSKKIKELGITPTMSVDEIDELVLKLAEKKEADGKSKKDAIDGQSWYVNDLKDFSALTAQERLDREYDVAFPEVADADEALDALEAIMAA